SFERFRGPDAGRLRGLDAVRKGTAMAAVEHEHLTLGEAAIHSARAECGLDGRSGQERSLGVAQCQIEMALVVLYAVAGEVEQEKVIALTPVAEAGNRPADRGAVLVQEGDDVIELSDLGRLEHALELV